MSDGKGTPGTNLTELRAKRGLSRFSSATISTVIVVASVGPLYLLVKQAITPELETFAWPPLWLPHRMTASHFLSVVTVSELRTASLLSVFVGALSAIADTALGAMLAYAMARNSRVQMAGVGLVSAARLLPMIAIGIPLTFALIRMGIYDASSGAGLIIVHTALAVPTTALTIYSAFRAIPLEIEEAAWLDGASPFRIFLTIDLPQARGALTAALILSFILSWDEFGFALLIQVAHRTLPPLLYYYTVFGDVGPASALALIMLVPAIAVVIALGPGLRAAVTGGIR